MLQPTLIIQSLMEARMGETIIFHLHFRKSVLKNFLWRKGHEQIVRIRTMKIDDYFFSRNDPRRGASFGAAGVHRNRGYGGIKPRNQFMRFTDFHRTSFSGDMIALPCASPARIGGAGAYDSPELPMQKFSSLLCTGYTASSHRGRLSGGGGAPGASGHTK